MNEPDIDIEDSTEEDHPIADHITGLGQKIVGGIETVGGVLTGDPNTTAEGGFNVEVGELRDETEEDLEESEEMHHRDTEAQREKE